MRLGVTYTVFSGLELLKPSLLNIRPFADHLVVVWSSISSSGDPAPEYMRPLLDSLAAEGLIDELIGFHPAIAKRPIEMQDNCRMKREVGRAACQAAGCTHHIVRDCDEFYDPDQFKSCMGAFEAMTVCVAPIIDYVQNPTTRIRGLSGLHVPTVHRIESRLCRYSCYGVTVDLGRTVFPVDSFKLLSADELVLHHYTSVRYNEQELRRKHQGHGHLNRHGTADDFVQKVWSYKPEDLEHVPDQFGIQKYWDGEFQQWLK